MVSADGSIDWTQFILCADGLITISDRIGDSWVRRHFSDDIGGIYLSKTVFKTYPKSEIQSVCAESDSGQTSSDSIDDQEASGLPLQTIIKIEYHIVYSLSYSVPVLYFTAHKSDGSVVQLEDIWKFVPKLYKTEESQTETEIRDDSDLYRQLGSILTQMEHPLLMRPFYVIHPCHTSTLMRNIFATKRSEDNRSPENRPNYLISWLSTMGPMAGLHMDMEYATVE